MSVVDASTLDSVDDATATPPKSARSCRAGWTPWLTCAGVAVLAQVPVIRDRWAFFSDDSATQILPMWHHLGERVRSGQWPPLLELDSWMGGNLAVESLFGVWNIVNALIWVFVSLIPDLAVAGSLVRTIAFVAVAFGCYGLCREYGAKPWASSAVAVTAPFWGSLFYFDAIKWPAALLAFVWIPFLWWSARRMACGQTNAIWVFVLGSLAVTSGNPYAMLAVCLVLAGVFVETLALARWRAARQVFTISAAIAAVVPLVYLPLLLSSHVTWRTSAGVENTGTLAPGLSDLMNFSVPSFIPEISGGVHDAAVYFCWFALPLMVWLDWSALGRRWRELCGCFVMGSFVLLALGPAEMWMFRWPLRVLHYGYLAAAVLFAVVLSAGLRLDHARRRSLGTGALLLCSAYLSWAARPLPEFLDRHAASLVLLGCLTATALWAYRARGPLWLAAVLQAGTVVALALQVFWFLAPQLKVPYVYPSSVAESRSNFEHRYQGQVMQIANHDLIGKPLPPREAWRDVLPGNLYLAAGVHSVNAYTGMGFTAFTDELCMGYVGQTCPDAYAALWRVPKGSGVPRADLLRLNTVVVQRNLIDNPRIPPGWAVSERNDRVTVLTRQSSLAFPQGRLSWATPDVRILSNTTVDDRHELVRFDRTGNGPSRLVFARLAWPGYTVRLNGMEWPAKAGPNGLLEVEIPPGAKSGQLRVSWSPPGMKAGLAAAGIGAIGAVSLGLLQARQKRRRAVPAPDNESQEAPL